VSGVGAVDGAQLHIVVTPVVEQVRIVIARHVLISRDSHCPPRFRWPKPCMAAIRDRSCASCAIPTSTPMLKIRCVCVLAACFVKPRFAAVRLHGATQRRHVGRKRAAAAARVDTYRCESCQQGGASVRLCVVRPYEVCVGRLGRQHGVALLLCQVRERSCCDV
jgi:hypothetical protein